MADSAEFELRLPPSTNHLFATIGRRRVKTRDYRIWSEEARVDVLAQQVPLIPGRIAVDIVVCKFRGDIDNRLKAILDSMVANDIIEDDSHINDLRIRHGEAKENRCTIRVWRNP